MGNILMEKINFIYEYEQDGVIFPNGLTEEAYNSTLEQIKLHGVSTNDFFIRGYTDHHMVINLSSRYPEKTFNVFYTRTIYENILHFFKKINDRKYTFEKNDKQFEVNLIKPDEIVSGEKNYYAINLFGNEDFLFQTPSLTVTNLEEKHSPHPPLLNLNERIINAIKAGDLKLIIATFHEGGVHYPSFFQKLYDSCHKLGLNPKDIHYVNADFNVNLQHELYCNGNFVFRKINCHFVDWLFTTACGAYSNNPYDEDVLNYEGDREKNFLIFNRSVFKDHRFWYLSQLQKNGVLDDCLFSMIFPYDREIKYGQDIYRGFPAFTNEEEFKKLLPYMQQVKDMGSIKIDEVDTFEDSTFYVRGRRVHYGWIDWSKPTFDFTFLRTYMTLLTESSFTSCQVSEKGVKALRYYHPFIAVAGPLYLEMLKEKGFRTFDKYFDESYDKIFNHADRMKAVAKLTTELNDKNKLHKIFMDSKEDVIYNSHLCRTFSDYQTIQELFYNIFEL
jgi:hypothetical protein